MNTALRKLLLACLSVPLVMLSHLLVAKENTMHILIHINSDKTIQAQLDDNPTARAFYALLPLSLSLRDFAGTEKASDALPEKLTTDEAPDGHKPLAGELTLYSPWNNLAIFYKDDKFAKGLVRIGQIKADSDSFDIPGNLDITISKDETHHD